VHRFTGVPFAALVGRLTGAPVVCHLRDAFRYDHVRSRGRLVARYAAVSAAVREHWIHSGLDASRITVVRTGVDLGEYPPAEGDERAQARRALGLPSEAFVALYCGRLDTEKGVEVLLEGWRRLGLAPEVARLVLIGEPVLHPDGSGYLRHLRDVAPAGCHWLPMRRDVVTAMHAADVVVVPSLTEGLPRTAIEAMATGCPVVGSRVGGVPEVLSGHFASFLFEAGNAAALAERLRGLLDWRRHDPGLARRCTSHVREQFSLQRMADGVESLLGDVVQGRSEEKERPSLKEREPV
jgi:glycosyltransferase involved in cell wall biosynthesis